MKPQEPDKQVFYNLLNKAVHKGEKVGFERRKSQKTSNYSGKRIHQHKTADVSATRRGKSHR